MIQITLVRLILRFIHFPQTCCFQDRYKQIAMWASWIYAQEMQLLWHLITHFASVDLYIKKRAVLQLNLLEMKDRFKSERWLYDIVKVEIYLNCWNTRFCCWNFSARVEWTFVACRDVSTNTIANSSSTCLRLFARRHKRRTANTSSLDGLLLSDTHLVGMQNAASEV